MTIKYVFSMLFLGPDSFIIPIMLEFQELVSLVLRVNFKTQMSDYLSVECEKGKRSCIWQLFMEMMPNDNRCSRNQFRVITQTCNSKQRPDEWVSWEVLMDSGLVRLYSHPLGLNLSSNRRPDNTFRWPELALPHPVVHA
ncbi:hypothetical protein OIU74_015673 [Salix koriyanagi]|uniref:Uncharacterized protein n=1 Tax=Salix koriyanagi TaxID=2511006 RepID=A0A9Q0SVN6_9ROSI|nr:hypothetical protein OIU74_015673 [Salix koriyanagi]